MKQEYLNERMETASPGKVRELQEPKFLEQLDYEWGDRAVIRSSS